MFYLFNLNSVIDEKLINVMKVTNQKISQDYEIIVNLN